MEVSNLFYFDASHIRQANTLYADQLRQASFGKYKIASQFRQAEAVHFWQAEILLPAN